MKYISACVQCAIHKIVSNFFHISINISTISWYLLIHILKLDFSFLPSVMLWRVVRCRWNISSELCCALLTGPTGEGGFFKASDERCGTEDWGLTSPNPRLGSLHFRQQFQLPDSPDWCWLPLLSWSLWLLQPRTGNKNVVVFFVFTCHVWCIACHVPVIPSSDGRGGGRRCFVFAVFSCWDTRLLSPLSPAPQTWKRCWRMFRTESTILHTKLYPVSSMLVWKDLQMKASFKNLW